MLGEPVSRSALLLHVVLIPGRLDCAQAVVYAGWSQSGQPSYVGENGADFSHLKTGGDGSWLRIQVVKAMVPCKW
jgi:hypothetical protein